MQMKIFKKRIVCLIMSAIILCFSCFCVNAENTSVNFIITPTVYSSEKDSYIDANEVKSGDTLFLKITASSIENLGGMSFAVGYEKDAFDFLKNSSICNIGGEEEEINYYNNTAKEAINVNYYNVSSKKATTTSGAIFYLAFSVKDVNNSGPYTFSFLMKELFDNSLQQKDIPANDTASCSIKISFDKISDDMLKAFAKLENIKHPDSKEDIDNALAIYNSLLKSQKNLLVTNYPSHYEWLSTAKTRFNRLAEEATDKALKSEVNKFKQDYADVLKLTVSNVSTKNEARVEKAQKALENCSNNAKLYLKSEEKLIDELIEKIEGLKEIEKEVSEFLNDPNVIYLLNKNTLANLEYDYDTYLPFLQTVLISYDLLSDEAKSKLKTEYAYLQKLNDTANKYIEDNAAAALLTEKINEFQGRYLYVFTLNRNNVKIEDKSAIEMVITAYNAISDKSLKEALKERMSKIEELLGVISNLENSKDDVTQNTQPNIENSVSQNSQQVQHIQQVIQQGANQNQQTGTNSVTTNNNVFKTIKKIVANKTGYSRTLLILFILLAVMVLTHMVIYVFCQKYKKKISMIYNGGEDFI